MNPATDSSQSTSHGVISFSHVSLRFGSHDVLREVTWRLDPGQTLVVIGESGCGKTVVLKLIIGLLRPTLGKVTIDGEALADLPDYRLTRERLRFGFLFQGAALFDSLNVFDNVAFGLRAKGQLTEKAIHDIVLQRVLEVGLSEGVLEKKPAELSGGMKKRVGLARALALDPEVMLYDEPTTGLDPIMSDVINELILQTRRRRPMTSVVVTHDMKTVRKVADRVLMLAPLARLGAGESQVVFDGTPEQLQASPERRVRQFVEGEAQDRLKEMAV